MTFILLAATEFPYFPIGKNWPPNSLKAQELTPVSLIILFFYYFFIIFGRGLKECSKSLGLIGNS